MGLRWRSFLTATYMPLAVVQTPSFELMKLMQELLDPVTLVVGEI